MTPGPRAPLHPTRLILPDLAIVVGKLDTMAKSVPVDAPWKAPNAAALDGQTLESWINATVAVTPRFRQVLSLATRPIFGAEPRELSLLFVLFYVASSGNSSHPGNFERNFDTRGGAQMSRFHGGSQVIALKIARALGTRVVLSSPVRRISQDRSGVTVQSDRLTVKAKRAIVAIPPTLAGRIDYQPILPFERDQLTQRYGQGTLTKVAAVYDRPFWRDQGLSGQAFSTTGPVVATFDDSPPGEAPASYSASSAATTPAGTAGCHRPPGGRPSSSSSWTSSVPRLGAPEGSSRPAGAGSNGRADARSESPVSGLCWPMAPG